MLKGRILNDNVSFRFLATCPEVSCRTRRAAITLAWESCRPLSRRPNRAVDCIQITARSPRLLKSEIGDRWNVSAYLFSMVLPTAKTSRSDHAVALSVDLCPSVERRLAPRD